MRNRPLNLDAFGISRWAYREMLAFCRQYDDFRREADRLLHERSNGRRFDPTPETAARRETLLSYTRMIEQAAHVAGGGGWEYAIIENCCRGVRLDCLDGSRMPTANRNSYYKARREFFFLLHRKRRANQ